jgi:flagellar hook assembly protein FlgD
VQENENTEIPLNYELCKNYPNPFNPTTNIQYELPQKSDVQISIYDLLGRKVTTLVSEKQDAGKKTVTWNATNDQGKPVSAGVYLYQIRAGEYVQTKKMLLIK